jgi:hypothetical protein
MLLVGWLDGMCVNETTGAYLSALDDSCDGMGWNVSCI